MTQIKFAPELCAICGGLDAVKNIVNVGPGWHRLVFDTARTLQRSRPQAFIYLIIDYNGGMILRIRYPKYQQHFESYDCQLTAAVHKSSCATFEACGAPGGLINSEGWTRCAKHEYLRIRC